MTMLQKAADWFGLFRNEFLRRAYIGMGYGGMTNAGVTVTEQGALQSAAVWACVRVLSQSCGMIPLHVNRESPDGSKTRALDAAAYPILHHSPNKNMTSVDWRQCAIVHFLLYGNHFSLIQRLNGRLIGLWPMRPDLMRVVLDTDGTLGYEYSTSTGVQKFAQADILHIRNFSWDGINGLSAISQARQAVGLTLAAEQYGASFFKNGGRPSGVLKMPQAMKPDVLQRIRESWEALHTGTNNSGRVAILENGMEYQAISIPPADAEFILTRKFQNSEIARLFGVPLHMIGDLDRATFSNIEHQGIEFVTHTLLPILVAIEQAIKKSLLAGPGESNLSADFVVDGLMRGDQSSRYASYAVGRQWGWLSVNDIRQLENMNKIPEGGDVYMQPMNMTDVSKPIPPPNEPKPGLKPLPAGEQKP